MKKQDIFKQNQQQADLSVKFKANTTKNMPKLNTLCLVVQHIEADNTKVRRFTEAVVVKQVKVSKNGKPYRKKVFESIKNTFCNCTLKGVTHFALLSDFTEVPSIKVLSRSIKTQK